MQASLKELRDRIDSVENTRKLTDAMRLVAAAKVRRAQEAVIGGRPFSENLVKVLYAVNQRLAGEDVNVPLTEVRDPVRSVLLVVCTGDRGLCGGFNSFVIRQVERRYKELKDLGIDVKLLTIGSKGSNYFATRKEGYNIVANFNIGQSPTTSDAQKIADEVYAEFVSKEVDKVELVYTKFVSLLKSTPTIQTMLPLKTTGQLTDQRGNPIDNPNDEIFLLTSQGGELTLERERETPETSALEGSISFEQDPSQILEALLPLYMNSQILRSLQESVASELAARMNAMGAASDNAEELSRNLNNTYQRLRQSQVTGELMEVVSAAEATSS
jgi:F-type H+-transporting ATPase subunit gamma